jgi:hypothetical protein
MSKVIIGLVIALVIIIGGNILLPVPRAAIEVAAEPIGLGPITNAMLTSFILSAIIVLSLFLSALTSKKHPQGCKISLRL